MAKNVKKETKKEIDLNQFLNEVEKRAYEIYENRIKNNIAGSDFTDWLQAEKEIKGKYQID